MITHNLFPTAVSKFELGRDLSNEELEFINSQERYKNLGNNSSINRYVLKTEALKNLNEFIEASVAQYFSKIYSPKQDVKLRITQSWLNYCKKDEFHHKHRHPNSLVSGVFYVKANSETDKIFFYNDYIPKLDIPTNNFNLYNSQTWWLEAHTGYLYLFPSTVEHSVEPVKEDTRISLSFNTFPVGFLGTEESLTALYL